MAEANDRFCRVLIIDDNAGIHDDIRRTLEARARAMRASQRLESLDAALFGTSPQKQPDAGLSFEIDSAYQGQEGLQKVQDSLDQKNPYMVAFVDMRMPPGWDGIETIAQIWKVDPYLQVVMCTAFTDRSWEEITAKLGASDGLLILKKPFESMELLQVTHALFKKWRLQREVSQKLDDLDVMVKERTSELETVNVRLKSEIEERTRAQEDLKHLATHDSLTGLSNRILMNERLHQATEVALKKDELVALLLVDLDDFKDVNDSHGHDYGDGVLQEVARRLGKSVGEDDMVARLGGDEFVVLLTGLKSPEEVEATARKIIAGFHYPMQIKDQSFTKAASIGISIFPSDTEDLEVLLKTADMAMYQAKQGGKNMFHFYCAKTNAEREQRKELIHELRQAVATEALDLWYQPLFDLQTNRVVILEAMMRWIHPEKGQIQPMAFLPLVEQTDLIHRLGEWVLREACGQRKKWRDSDLPAVSIAVNASMGQFLHDGFAKIVKTVLTETEVQPQELLLEITESTVLRDFERCRKTAKELAEFGVRLVIDDFGSGAGAVGKLKQLPLYGLKVSAQFPGHAAADREVAAQITSTIAIAHSLGIHVIAERIETDAQLAYLKALQGGFATMMCCDIAQGYLLGRPLPGREAERILRQNRPDVRPAD